jgi:uncharacterized integral membrane protein
MMTEVKRQEIHQAWIKGGIFMQFFFWLAFLAAIALAVFVVQNCIAAAIVLKFLFWQFETRLIYTILGSIGSGMVIILLLWIPSAIRASLRSKNLKKEIEILEREMKHQMEATKPKEP